MLRNLMGVKDKSNQETAETKSISNKKPRRHVDTEIHRVYSVFACVSVAPWLKTKLLKFCSHDQTILPQTFFHSIILMFAGSNILPLHFSSTIGEGDRFPEQ